MRLPKETYDEFIKVGCKPFDFRTVNPYIHKLCKQLGIVILEAIPHDEVDEIVKMHSYPSVLSALVFKRAQCFETINLILIHSWEFNNRFSLEFALLHEIGHVYYEYNNPEDPDKFDEQNADEYAINKLAGIYGWDKALQIYRRWLFKECKLNKVTCEYDFPKESFTNPKTEKKHSYKHRKEWLDLYINEGLEKFSDDFD